MTVIQKLIVAAVAIWAFSGTGLAQGIGIAGVTPDRRPANAPTITEMPKDGEWYRQALTGVEAPYPGSLRFLEDQQNWFTPFNHPGMTGPYDIRNWHAAQ